MDFCLLFTEKLYSLEWLHFHLHRTGMYCFSGICLHGPAIQKMWMTSRVADDLKGRATEGIVPPSTVCVTFFKVFWWKVLKYSIKGWMLLLQLSAFAKLDLMMLQPGADLCCSTEEAHKPAPQQLTGVPPPEGRIILKTFKWRGECVHWVKSHRMTTEWDAWSSRVRAFTSSWSNCVMRYMGGLSDLLMTRVLLQENICVSCGTMRSICVWLMRICHLKYSQHSAFIAVCLKLSEPTHGGISVELLSRLLPCCFCLLIHPNAHLIKGRGCEGLCYAFLLASNLWLFERSWLLEAVSDWSDHGY